MAEALAKYKYQPFVEKRHEQLKSVFGVMPVWLKSPRRVASLLWLYYVVELVQALVEREVRRQMRAQHVRRLALYPEGAPVRRRPRDWCSGPWKVTGGTVYAMGTDRYCARSMTD